MSVHGSVINDDQEHPCFGHNCLIEESAQEEEYGTYFADALFVTWGIYHTWMAIFGGLIWRWYPGYIQFDPWWMRQCPQYAWTSTLITDNDSIVNLNGTKVKTEVIVNGWTQQRCLKAAPIFYWNIEAWWMMISYSVGLIFWFLNGLFGNNGGLMHLIWVRFSETAVIQPIFTLIWAYYADQSYGT